MTVKHKYSPIEIMNNLYKYSLTALAPDFAAEHEEFLNSVPYSLFDFDVAKSKEFAGTDSHRPPVDRMWKLAYEEYVSLSMALTESRPELATLLNRINDPHSHPYMDRETEQETLAVLASFPVIFYRSATNKYILGRLLRYSIDYPFLISEGLAEKSFRLSLDDILGDRIASAYVYVEYLRKCRTFTSFTYILLGFTCSIAELRAIMSTYDLVSDIPVLKYLVEKPKRIVELIVNYQEERSGPLTDEAFKVFSCLFETFKHLFNLSNLIHLIRNINTEREDIAITIYGIVIEVIANRKFLYKEDKHIRDYSPHLRLNGIVKRELSDAGPRFPALTKAIKKRQVTFLRKLICPTPDPTLPGMEKDITSARKHYIWCFRLHIISIIPKITDGELMSVLAPSIRLGNNRDMTAFKIGWDKSLSEGECLNILSRSMKMLYKCTNVEFFARFIALINFREGEFNVIKDVIYSDISLKEELRAFVKGTFSTPESYGRFLEDFGNIVGFNRCLYELYFGEGWLTRMHAIAFIRSLPQSIEIPAKHIRFLYYLLMNGYKMEISRSYRNPGDNRRELLYIIARRTPYLFMRMIRRCKTQLAQAGGTEDVLAVTYMDITTTLEKYANDLQYYEHDAAFFKVICESNQSALQTFTWKGQSLLSIVCGRSYPQKTILSIVSTLLKCGINVNTPRSPFFLEDDQSNEEVPMIMHKERHIAIPPILNALKARNLRTAEYLIEKGAEVSVRISAKAFESVLRHNPLPNMEKVMLGAVEALLLFNHNLSPEFQRMMKMFEERELSLNVAIPGVGNAIDLHLHLSRNMNDHTLLYLLERGISPVGDGASGNALIKYTMLSEDRYRSTSIEASEIATKNIQALVDAGIDVDRKVLISYSRGAKSAIDLLDGLYGSYRLPECLKILQRASKKVI